jgi:hypothetical protein
MWGAGGQPFYSDRGGASHAVGRPEAPRWPILAKMPRASSLPGVSSASSFAGGLEELEGGPGESARHLLQEQLEPAPLQQLSQLAANAQKQLRAMVQTPPRSAAVTPSGFQTHDAHRLDGLVRRLHSEAGGVAATHWTISQAFSKQELAFMLERIGVGLPLAAKKPVFVDRMFQAVASGKLNLHALDGSRKRPRSEEEPLVLPPSQPRGRSMSRGGAMEVRRSVSHGPGVVAMSQPRERSMSRGGAMEVRRSVSHGPGVVAMSQPRERSMSRGGAMEVRRSVSHGPGVVAMSQPRERSMSRGPLPWTEHGSAQQTAWVSGPELAVALWRALGEDAFDEIRRSTLLWHSCNRAATLLKRYLEKQPQPDDCSDLSEDEGDCLGVAMTVPGPVRQCLEALARAGGHERVRGLLHKASLQVLSTQRIQAISPPPAPPPPREALVVESEDSEMSFSPLDREDKPSPSSSPLDVRLTSSGEPCSSSSLVSRPRRRFEDSDSDEPPPAKRIKPLRARSGTKVRAGVPAAVPVHLASRWSRFTKPPPMSLRLEPEIHPNELQPRRSAVAVFSPRGQPGGGAVDIPDDPIVEPTPVLEPASISESPRRQNPIGRQQDDDQIEEASVVTEDVVMPQSPIESVVEV